MEPTTVETGLHNRNRLNLVLTALITTLVIGTGVYVYQEKQKEAALEEVRSQLTTPETKSTPSPSATSPNTPASSSRNTYSKPDYATQLSFPKNWLISESGNCEGLCNISLKFTIKDPSKDYLTYPLPLSVYTTKHQGLTSQSLDELIESEYRKNNSGPMSETTLAGLKAKKLSDGGGMFGETYTIVAYDKNFYYVIEYSPSVQFYTTLMSEEEFQREVDALIASFTIPK